MVGSGSQHFLENQDDTLRIFLYAPRREKLRRVMAGGKSEIEAEELVDTVDRERVAFVQKYFGVEWPTRWLYRLMLNTAIGEGTVVRTISISCTRSTPGSDPRPDARSSFEETRVILTPLCTEQSTSSHPRRLK